MNIGLYKIITSSGSLKIKFFKLIDFLIGGSLAFILPAVSRVSSLDQKSIKDILVIRPGGIGDAVFLLPILRVIIKQGIKVDILCERRNAEIFRSQKIFAHVYCYDNWNEFWRVLNNFYDAIFDTEQWHYLSALMARSIKTYCRIGFVTRPLRAKFFNIPVDYGINTYELDNFHKLFAELISNGMKINTIDDSFEIPFEMQSWAHNKVPKGSVAVFIGASIPERRLTHEQITSIVRFILEKNIHVVLLGGKDVMASSQAVIADINDQRLHNYAGRISLLESAALIQKSRLFVGTDSGLMHLACAVGVPVVAIFGPGQKKKWGLQDERHGIFSLDLPCSPCTQFGYTIPTCRGSYHCMRDIQMPLLCSAIERQLLTRGKK